MDFPLEERIVATLAAAAMPMTPKEIAEQIDIYFPPSETLAFEPNGQVYTTTIMTDPKDVAKCIEFSARRRFDLRGERENDDPSNCFTFEVSPEIKESISEGPYSEAYRVALNHNFSGSSKQGLGT